MDKRNYKNKNAEDFFLNTVHEVEDMPMDQCSFLLNRFYQEACNPEKFNSEFYANQDDRIDDMFPESSAPEPLRNFLKFKSYEHQSDKEKKDGVKDEEKSKFNKKRVEDLQPVVAQSEYAEFTVLVFWAS